MVKIAQVIVDVPLMQTDKPFSYIIPKNVEDQVTIGSRVHVPFGRGNRLLQGFVVGFSDTFDNTVNDLKAISEVLDFEPVLNAEQLELAEQMRHTVFSYKISILKSMIPNLLNSQYDKRLTPTESLSSEEHLALFGEKESRLHSSLTEEEVKKVARLVQAGKITVDYLAKDKKNIKTEKYYHVQAEKIVAADISNRAKKRLELRDYLLEHPEEGKLSDLHHLFSRDVVKFFVDNQLITVLEREKKRSDAYFDVATTDFLDLNAEQAAVVEQVTSQIGQESKPFLLEGVTGSGKTEVYLHIIDKVLKLGKTAIVLVPEISLTPQMTNRFISRFGKQVAIMHSALSDGEKFDEWRKIKSGQAHVVVGARSAIFVPIENIGAIIIDEEHEATYKQESNPRYHARDVALLRAKYHKAILLMGSATPSIESRARASRGVYQFLQLTHRANPMAKIPKVEIVDFRDYVGQQEVSNFTPYLLEKIADRLEKNEQVVLMLNRRGYSSFIMCRDCGYVDECPNCDISLTLHMDTKTMNCHYCGFEKSIPHTCPNCHSRSIRYYGTGTQKAYDELVEVFPQARILRMDVDTTRQKGAHQRILDKFGNHEADILLGTQMIAKGLDFPNVTLVGVLNADTSLNLPDFRSSERTFQLLTQVAGRAGRAEKEGEVLIQTYNPQHYAIQLAQKQDYEAFYAYEMGIRRQLAYPPYYFTVGLTLSHKDEQTVVRKSFELLQLLRQQLSDKIKILGPTPKPIARTHNLYHYQIIVKYRFEDNLENVLNQILDLTQLPENKDLRLVIDYEPQNFM
ncbi:primosomal protein N' [Streptococcus gallolyticus subsp. gallolyticus]|uniref:Replication restart protein PriA n=1 Tax=Streptococcus gallolyticus (strain UCN34) TaxID=637909 RepID=A0AA36JWK2_STRG3|nr:primosomal protein N' [Streptococcus gallolyticus]KJF00294.1 primosomal protein DnaI [Streptococcus gallolyticus subsp. gallolyticus]MCQ9216768.1 primosomal protein N' [Streptococcus gallolyticus]MCY7194688.1 primosomal protein N' [Streptococcus gallolyticus subsp. gallolyticus]OAV81536.1 primosomal protein N' [Streptococcus gallolyticus subsp. gallolyticus]OCW48465.1 primosomal protein N' [Streptococcus gallolyticus subsp. gallolyticus]